MSNAQRNWLRAATIVLTGPLIAQGSLTTTFGSNNGLPSSGAGNFFDIEVKNRFGLKITMLDVNTYASTTTLFQAAVFVIPGTYVGSETNEKRWVHVASAFAKGAGQNKPTRVDVPDFFLAPGKYGLYIGLASGGPNCGPRYTNGTGRNQVYQNKDLVLRLGTAITRPFAGTIHKDRVWNGAIHYAADNAEAWGSYAPGCPGSNGSIPILGMMVGPRLDRVSTIYVSNTLRTSSNTAVLLLGLPKVGFDLAAIGMPGCILHTNIIFVLGVPLVNAAGSWSSKVPNRASLIGDIAHLQAACADPRANRLGFAVSNAISIRVGK